MVQALGSRTSYPQLWRSISLWDATFTLLINVSSLFKPCRLHVWRCPYWLKRFFRVLMLHRKAFPTETELRLECSHMVNEALEMIALEWHFEATSEGFRPSISTDAQAQPWCTRACLCTKTSMNQSEVTVHSTASTGPPMSAGFSAGGSWKRESYVVETKLHRRCSKTTRKQQNCYMSLGTFTLTP